jgi:hypothetical protein
VYAEHGDPGATMKSETHSTFGREARNCRLT